MSFQTIATISLLTEVVVISAIVLTLINAFSEGRLYAFVSRCGRVAAKPDVAVSPVVNSDAARHDDAHLRRAA